ncbi:putative M18 family aminopeptidase 2 [Citricoccus zhacaiensis]|uniref:M18 family aminopeptidase n=1 Tax=Citricoccus zhacaiensis TaxID=489142 RepID=A0ABQ2LSW0_9MICC|nr:M18 family aminopeptidase [Citricoccus zhacaiensis]GGO42914.1 putative M18 family aminopeptidase 2 [Citricoccus zhacaiensis]
MTAPDADSPRLTPDLPEHLQDLADFVMASPSSYHAAAEVARRLEAAGYVRVNETVDFPAEPGGYVLVRDGAVMAWRIPDAGHLTSTPVFRILGAHTDSPTFKLKPRPSTTREGWLQAGVEVYGGPLLNSWLDRELCFAGRMVTVDGREHLVRTGPIARFPQLAIHLDREVNSGLKLDRQQHLNPIWGAVPAGGAGWATDAGGRSVDQTTDILAVLARTAGLEADAVAGFDVVMADTQAPGVFGASGELFASGRLDNLSSVHAGLVAMESLTTSSGGVVADGVAGESTGAPVIPVLAAFDHEELGSASRSGAAGPVLEDVLRRVLDALGVSGQGAARSFSGSWLLSADAGHLVHPNYAERHDPVNHPRANGGPLLKINANQRYSTDAAGAAAFARWCGVAGVPFQEFVSNNGVPCGSTIGPISATRLGIRTVDVGIGLLSMHSAREMCGAEDPARLAAAVTAFYEGV